MASPTVNILRWSFLGFGVIYGFRHQRHLYAEEKAHNAKKDWEHKEKLIEQARAAYKTSLLPPDQRNTVISNPDDPKFDLEKYLISLEASTAASKAKA